MKDLFDLLNELSGKNTPDLSSYNRVITEWETDSHITIKEVWTSADGVNKFTKVQEILKSDFMEKDFLDYKLTEALENEDYEMAAKFRDKIKKLGE